MRIGLITTSYPRFDGDLSGAFVAEHAAFLAGAGFDVEVIAAGDADPHRAAHGRADRDHTAAISVHRVRAPAGLFYGGGAPEALAARGSRAWLDAARFTAALRRAVAARARHWDAAVCHWLAPSALAALTAAPRLPLLAIAHSGDVHLLRRAHALTPVATLCALGRVRLSFVTHELRRLGLGAVPGPLRRRLRHRSQVCPMGVNVPRLRAAAADRGGGAAGRAATVLFLGRLVPVKGVDVLIAAATRWRSAAQLVIAGAGPAERALRRAASAAPPGRIRFAGEVRGAERDRMLGAADLVVLPSIRVEGGRTEGMPQVALEAMAAGTPLVGSAVGGLAELPPTAITRVQPGDAPELARAVDALLADPARRSTQIDAQERFVAGFDWSVVGRRLMPPLEVRSLTA